MSRRETLDDLIDAKEGESYQFKEWKSKGDFKEAAKICCALSNCGGGKLVLGVTDKRPRKVVGTAAFPQPERTRADLMDKLKVHVDFDIYRYDNMRVLVFEVASHPIGLPVQVDSGTWWYLGDSLIPIPEEVRHSIYDESGHDFSADICHGITVDDLDDKAIKVFRRKWRENRGGKRIAGLSNEQLLRDIGALTDKGVTYAALILFGKNIPLRQNLTHAEIIFEYRSKESAGPAAHREEFQTGFFNCFDRIWELINLRNDDQHYQNRFQVLPVSTFNEQAVREGILNAASHRDYKKGGSIFVRQFARRIEIENPGGFPSGITVDNILDKQNARNKLIAGIFQLCGLVERAGQGMNLVYELSMKEAKPLPDFKGSDAYSVKLTLYGQVFDTKMLALVKKTSDEILDAMTIDDYMLLCTFFHRRKYAEIHRSRFEHLADLGLVNLMEHGIELVDGGITLLTDENGIHIVDNEASYKVTNEAISHISYPSDPQSYVNRLPIVSQSSATNDWQTIGAVGRKNQIVEYIRETGTATSSQLAKLTSLTQGRIRTILIELVADGVIEKVGNYRYTAYRVKNNYE